MALRKTVRYGTKIKFYLGVKGSSLEDADVKAAKLGEAVMETVNKLL